MSPTRHVLVIDNDREMRLLLAAILSDEGYLVTEAANGRAALAFLPQLQPDVLLLDLRMPVMDGAAFVAAYRQLAGRAAPIVVLSGEADGQQQAAALGVAGYLRKPFDLEDLLASVQRHLAVPTAA